MSGKGHMPRPFLVPREQYEADHERIFGKRERKQWVPPPQPKENDQQKGSKE